MPNASPGLEGLKNELLERLSADEIATVMAENPHRAKNEIRSACARVFEGDHWQLVPAEEQERLVEGLIDTVFGLGPLEALLADEDITEIMVNGPYAVFYEREGKISPSAQCFENEEQVRALIDRIIGPLGRRIDEAAPMVNARLKQGHRVNAIIPPLALDGPVLTIRKFRERHYTLDELVEIGSLDAIACRFLRWAVRARKNIAVSGGTGSGKTTLLNALSCEIPRQERIITIEDSAELKFSSHPHVVRLEARPRNVEGIGEVSIRDLVINALRMRPDRIIVGECRGGEALDMLQAMNTGHDGSLTTLHANSVADVLTRLSTMVRYVADLPIGVIEAQITSALEVVVQLARSSNGRRSVREIASFAFSHEKGKGSVVSHFTWDHETGKGRWLNAPAWIDGLVHDGLANKEEVEEWKSGICSSS
jgi:pilus assembly protein CpaF